MTDLERVLVLAGGLSVERDVSLRSGRRVVEALRSVGVDAEVLDPDAGLLPRLIADPPSAVFVALHGGPGEDGAIQAVLDLVRIPHAGSPASACRLAFDKPDAKAIVQTAGISTSPWLALPHATFRELGAGAIFRALVANLGLPLVVKPAAGGSALGVGVVTEAEQLPAALVNSFGYGESALIERYVEGTELAVTVLDRGDGPVALPPVEITAAHGRYDYSARYTAGATEFHVPARLDDEVLVRAREVAVTAHRALGLADISRTDCIVDADGIVQFLEVNVSPGLTETSLVPLAVHAEGLEMGVVLRDLLQAAVLRSAGGPARA
ncbi:MAG TPA: D-alanine--D-alanine ligase [Frankiaceae bacterium]|nr:D-alanine--D-alanine ligase [Frankiaceae bacterium]